MKTSRVLWMVLGLLLCGSALSQQKPEKGPWEGQPGKDVIWIASPATLVEQMLELAKVTPQDFVIDLGSGDGRNVIAAAKRGARALGVEYDPGLHALAVRNAAAAGVSDRARFIQGDMFEADISSATALVLFLIPQNLQRLLPRFLEMAPGTRIVTSGYPIPGWHTGERGVASDCGVWCDSYLYIVPAKLAGTWRLPWGELKLEQEIDTLEGTLVDADGAVHKVTGKVSGERFELVSKLSKFTGRFQQGRLLGEASGEISGRFTAFR